jgi:tetratricopeptide (TPR) repeat protein
VSQQDFAERLRTLRSARGLTQRDLAGDALSISYVSLLESGRRQPTPATVKLLAQALSCDVADLVGPAESTAPVALLLTQAELALRTGHASGARERYEQVLATQPSDPSVQHRATVGMAQALQRLGRLQEAADIYERCMRAALDDPAQAASIQVFLGWCRCLYELGELLHAAEVGTAALNEIDAVKAQESELAIQLIATVAAVWYELGDLRQAERLLDEGLDRASRVKSPTARGAILWNASTLAYEKHRYQEALELADEALNIFQGGSDQRSVGRLLTTRGYFLLRADVPRPREALDALTQALGKFSDSGDPVDVGYALTELSHAHLALGEVEEAIRAAEESRRHLGGIAQLEHARATMALAVALQERGELGRARELYAEAASVLEDIGATRHAARAWVELAHALADSGDVQGALAAHDRAARAMNLDDPRWRSRGRRNVAVPGRGSTPAIARGYPSSAQVLIAE